MVFIIVFLVSSGLVGRLALADQDDGRLRPLFEQLLVTNSLDTAKVIEQDIWRIWMSSGNAVVDRLMLQGVQQMTHGKFQQAATTFTAITEISPKFAEGWNKRATVRFLMGDHDGSIEDVGRTLALEPRHFGALAGLGQMFERRDADAMALKAFEQAVKLNPHMPQLLEKIQALRLNVYGTKT
ncbi:MAG: hypothetical protein V7727_15205 [Sneathiella sp.]